MRILTNEDHAKTDVRGLMITEMTAFATGVHALQFVNDDTPMIVHLMNVCHYISCHDEELQCIAMGHELFNDPHGVDASDMILIGMSDRIISALELLKHIPLEHESDYLNRVIKNPDTLRITELCYRDKYINAVPRSIEATRLSNIIIQLTEYSSNARLFQLSGTATRFRRNKHVGCRTLPSNRIRRNTRRG